MSRSIFPFLFLLCFFLLGSLNAQTYTPLLKNTAWYNEITFFGLPRDEWYLPVGQDTLNGKVYTKYQIEPFSVCCLYHLREDTIQKQVFSYSISSGQEIKLYDFGLTIGDTFTVKSSGVPILFTVVNETMDTTMAGIRKKTTFQRTNGHETFSVTEGVGSNKGPFNVWDFYPPEYHTTICSYQENIQTYHYGGSKVCPPLPVTSFNNENSIQFGKEETLVFPNPNNGKFNLNRKVDYDSNVPIKLYSISGEIVWEGYPNGSLIELPEDLKEGLYLLSYSTRNGSVSFERILISNSHN